MDPGGPRAVRAAQRRSRGHGALSRALEPRAGLRAHGVAEQRRAEGRAGGGVPRRARRVVCLRDLGDRVVVVVGRVGRRGLARGGPGLPRDRARDGVRVGRVRDGVWHGGLRLLGG